MRCLVYAIDYSGQWHGNGCLGSTGLPPSVWVIRVTAYATTHGATWAKRIAKMPAGQARAFLQSCMGMPGSAWLGTEAGRQKQLRRQPPDESGPSALELGEGVAPGEWVRVAGSDVVGWLCVDPSKTSNRYWLMTPDGHGEQWLDEGRVELAAAPGRRRGKTV